MRSTQLSSVALSAVLAVGVSTSLSSCSESPQSSQRQPTAQTGAQIDNAIVSATPPDSALHALRYRQVGPFKGGRSTAVAGVASQPFTFYFGSTGGGVWRTTDAGGIWQNVSDGFFETGEIGAIAVSESDPNVVYVGTGSACIRGNVSPGVGVYKSIDAGHSWRHIGLRDAGQIGRIRIHPKDPNVAYVAALGHAFGPNEERGVFRSLDGGQSWAKVLYVSPNAGAVDLSMDAHDPRTIYAAIWQTERKPWTITSGGENDGLYKTTDGGDHWQKLTAGLPAETLGRIGVAVSPVDSKRIYAIVEAQHGGVFRSDDGGQSFALVNGDQNLRGRPFYYSHIFPDPKAVDTVYVANQAFHKSTDGGKTYSEVTTSKNDNHDLWINPNDPNIMIESNDGGATVSLTGGKSWSTALNEPTGEIYHVTADTQFPYRIYGAQQDMNTVSLPTLVTSDQQFGAGPFGPVGISIQYWTSVGGCESGDIAVNPKNPRIVFAGCQGGVVTRTDTTTSDMRMINPYPERAGGMRGSDMKYRFQWTAPIRLSPHDPAILYTTSNYVHRSKDEGQNWELISPDLTRDDESKQDYSGGPISPDNSGTEIFGTIFAFEESRRVRGLLWAGSDDGLVHLSRDDGHKWDNVTPRAIPEWATVNMIEPSPHDPARAFLAVHRYRLDDFHPYIFRTDDYGATWDLLTDGKNGIPANHFVRVVREDPDRKGLLYAGTEFGVYASFDDGKVWQSLQLNLPRVPVYDLIVHQKDLVLATKGRAFWILDNLTPLHQRSPEMERADAHLLKPRDAYRLPVRGGTVDDIARSPTANAAPGYLRDFRKGAILPVSQLGENGPIGTQIYYHFARKPTAPVALEILDSGGSVIRRFAGSGSANRDAGTLSMNEGLNLFTWDMRYDAPEGLSGPRTLRDRGPRAVPGTYQVRLSVGDWSQTEQFKVLPDPRLSIAQRDFEEQFHLMSKIRDRLTSLYAAVRRLREERGRLSTEAERNTRQGKASESTQALIQSLTDVEGALARSGGAVGLPSGLDGQFVYLYGVVDNAEARPTQASQLRFNDLSLQLDRQLDRLQRLSASDR